MLSLGMGDRHSAAFIVRSVREQAALSQRELATRAHTAQSVIARIESGKTDPGLKTLERVVAAAGFLLTVGAETNAVIDSHMLDDVQRILQLTPEQRLLEMRNISCFVAAARRG